MQTEEKRRQRVFTAVTLLIALAIGLGISEIVLRIAFPEPDRYYLWPPGAEITHIPDPGLLYGVEGPSVYTTNEDGVRGDSMSGDYDTRILVFGGSTTECIYLDQPESWPYLTESLVNEKKDAGPVWIGNVGKSGLNSKDHVAQFEALLPQFEDLDAVIVMAGVNDVSAALREADLAEFYADPYSRRELLSRSFYAYPEMNRDAPFLKRTGLWRLARRAKLQLELMFPPEKLRENYTGRSIARWRRHRAEATRTIDELPDLAPALNEFENDMKKMVGLAKEQGVRPVFLTHPAMWSADLDPDERNMLWMGGVGAYMEEEGHAYYTPRALAGALSLFHDVQLQVCEEEGLDCFDIASLLPRGKEVMFDDCHFHEAGSRQAAGILADYLAGSLPTWR